MKNILLYICLLLFATVHAQRWQWAHTADSTTAGQHTQMTNADKICCDNLGNVYVLGSNDGMSTFGNTVLDSGSFVAKYNSIGVFQWARHINNYGRDLETDSFGNLYVLDDSINIHSYHNVYKFTTTGILLWEKSYLGWALDLAVYQNSSIFVTGYTSSNFFLSKLNNNGVPVWLSTGLTNCATGCYGAGNLLSLDKNGIIYVVGNGNYSNCMYCSGWFLAKFDTLGNIVYSDFKWGQYADNSTLAVDDSLNIYCLYSTGGHYFNGYDVAKYDSLLNPIWVNHYNSYGNYYLSQGLVIDKLGNLYLGGGIGHDWQNIDSALVYNNWYHVKGRWDAAVFKLDRNGNFVWAKTAGGRGFEGSTDICISKMGTCYVTGNIDPIHNSMQKDTVSFDNSQLVCPAKRGQLFVASLDIASTTLSLETFNTDDGELILYPNPNSGRFTIRSDNYIFSGKVTVTDVLGKCYYNNNFSEGKCQQIDLSCQPSGIYFVEISSENNRIVKKVVVQ